MRIRVKVQPGAKTKSINIIQDLLSGEDVYVVRIQATPVDGKANKALIEDLSEYFQVPKRNISIISGQKSRMKLVEVDFEDK